MNRMLMIVAVATLMVAGCGKPAAPPAPATASDAKGATSGTAPVAAVATTAIDDKQALEIMHKSGCAACHAIDKKIMGPAYTDVAKKRKGEPGAAATIEKKIREGGGGAYGPIPMPPNPRGTISDNDLTALVKWILTK